MLLTAHDAQDTLMNYLGGNNSAEALHDVRSSINDALKELWGEHDWPYYQGQKALQLNEPYDTGTIAYNSTTQRFTLSGGTWPSWAEYGTISIGTLNAKVAKRYSDTVIELEPGSGFIEDIAAGEEYTLYRNEYPLPDQVRKLAYVTVDNYTRTPMLYVPPIEFNPPANIVAGTPRNFTVQKDRRIMGGLSIVFWPVPRANRTVRFCYIRSPKPIKIWSYSAGTISVTANSTSVTGVGTAWDADMEESMLRISKNQTAPTARIGNNPFSEEVIIDSVDSATALTCLPPTATLRTSVKYDISSVVDIDEEIMNSAFTQQMYWELAKRREMQGKIKTEIEAALVKAIRSAKSKACVDRGIEYAGSFIRGTSLVWIRVGT